MRIDDRGGVMMKLQIQFRSKYSILGSMYFAQGVPGGFILTTLLYALKDRSLQKGLAALCLGGGNAVALSVEIC